MKVIVLISDKARVSGSSFSVASTKDFNDGVRLAIDHVICGIVGQDVLNSLYNSLKGQYGITSDEVPYRLDTLFATLERTFGVAGARTLTRAIAREIYYDHNIDFRSIVGYTLQDYVEEAKRILQMADAIRAKSDSEMSPRVPPS